MLKGKKMCLLWGLLVLFIAVDQAAAVSVSVVPSGDSVRVGETIRVDLYLDDLLEGDLTSYRMELNYDNPVCVYQTINFGAYTRRGTESVSDYDAGNEIGGVIIGSDTNSGNGQPQDILLGSLFFTAVAEGECWFTFAHTEFYADGDSIPLSIDLIGTAYVQVTAPVPVTPVPEPATMVLLGTGIAGLAVSRKKRMS